MTLEGVKVVFIMDACRSNEHAGGEERIQVNLEKPKEQTIIGFNLIKLNVEFQLKNLPFQ
jgi:hypothetical protein